MQRQTMTALLNVRVERNVRDAESATAAETLLGLRQPQRHGLVRREHRPRDGQDVLLAVPAVLPEGRAPLVTPGFEAPDEDRGGGELGGRRRVAGGGQGGRDSASLCEACPSVVLPGLVCT